MKTLISKIKIAVLLMLLCSGFANGQAFITRWQTDNPGQSAINQVTIPAVGAGYNYNVVWQQVGNAANNGTLSNLTGQAVITFPFAGTYEVQITGAFPRFQFPIIDKTVMRTAVISSHGFVPTDAPKLLSVEQWGNQAWDNFAFAFIGCVNLQINAIDAPNLSNVTDLQGMFAGCVKRFNQPIGNWDVSHVTKMNGMFLYCIAFNQPLAAWDVSNVTTMKDMFLCDNGEAYFGGSAFNQNIGGWDVGNVTDMTNMFSGSTAFNQDIGGWNMSNVTKTDAMFYKAKSFNQDISGWDVSNVTNMRFMFAEAWLFNKPIGNWNTSNVTNMQVMFDRAFAFNQPIGNWDVSKVTIMKGMFADAVAFNQDISNWDVSSVTDMNGMFASGVLTLISSTDLVKASASFDKDISTWDVGNVDSMAFMFARAKKFNHDLGGWNIQKVKSMRNMFDSAGISQVNYDATITAWASKPKMPNVTVGALGIPWCSSGAARTTLTSAPNNWTFVGDVGCPKILATEIGGTVSLETTALTFGPINIDTTWVKTITLQNLGNDPLQVTSISADGDFSVISSTDPYIPALGIYSINIRFTPTGPGTRTGVLTIVSNAVTPTFTINLSGISNGPLLDLVSAGNSIIPLGTLRLNDTGVGLQSQRTLVLENDGRGPLVISGMEITGGVFTIVSEIPGPIQPGETALLDIDFTPVQLGEVNGTLTVFNNGHTPVYEIDLVGDGDAEPEVYNIVTTNVNGKHDFLNIRNITLFPGNRVMIYDRWGNLVYDKKDYDNVEDTFAGTSKNGTTLPEGTYYYVVDKNNGSRKLTGPLLLRR